LGNCCRIAGVCLLAVACGGSQPAPAAPKKAAATTEVERYLPLEHDTVLSFATFSEQSPEQGLLVIEISRPRPDMVELKVAGRIQRLLLEADGVKSADGGYLLKTPLTKDATFTGNFGPVKITDVAKSIKVPAGTFANCIETVEEATIETIHKKTTTVYCPGIGITMRQTEAANAEQSVMDRIELKSHGPRFRG
jgi:hypothetical protein